VLDVLLDREPYAKVSIQLFGTVEKQVIQGFLCATTITTVDYLIAKTIGRDSAKKAINNLLELFLITDVNQKVLKTAVNSNFSDFEDAVLYQSGFYAGVDALVTRNSKDFKPVALPIYSPDQLWSIIQTGS
jgi:predicted nucleic acid-binding protein